MIFLLFYLAFSQTSALPFSERDIPLQPPYILPFEDSEYHETEGPEYEVVNISPVALEVLDKLEDKLKEAMMRRDNGINIEKVWLEPTFERDTDFLEFTKKDQEKILGKGDENNKDREISLRKSPKNHKFPKQLPASKQEEGMEETEMWNSGGKQFYRTRKIRSTGRQ